MLWRLSVKKAMNVAELIKWLEQQDPDALVLLHDPYGGMFLRIETGPVEGDPPQGCVVLHGKDLL
jgi:hypothetical protein